MPEIDITWLFPDGAGGAKTKSGVVRVAGALPGDRVRYRETSRRGSTVEGELEAVLAASPDRREPACAWDAACGGCDLSALAPAAREKQLATVAQRALNLDAPPPWVPSPRATAHRARIKLAVDGGRVGYRAPRSHELVEIGTCAVAREEVQAALARLRTSLPADVAASALQGAGRDGADASVELRSDGQRVVYAFEGVRRSEGLASLGDVAVDGKPLSGDPTLWLDVLGLRLRASPRSFYQVNLEVDQLLVRHVRDLVVAERAERVLDLYAGIGNLSLPIAAAGVPVVAVELEGQAVADLRASAEAARLDVRAVAQSVDRFDPSREAFDVAVLDPPRAGAPDVVRRLVLNRPRAIVYVSCNVPSAARDLREATSAGYRVVDVRCFDLFPETRHFETVVLLRRERGGR